MKNLLKYGIMVLAIIIASTGLLWADCYVEVDTITQAEVAENIACDSTANDIESRIDSINNVASQVSEDIELIGSLPKEEEKIENGCVIAKWYHKLVVLLILLLIIGVIYLVSTKIIREGYFKSIPYKTLNNALKYIARSVLVILVLFVLFVIIRIFFPTLIELNFATLGVIGDFTGGVIGTLIAVFGAMYVVKSYKRQVSQARLQTFEETCATMLELHKQNVQEIEIDLPGGGKLTGRKAFPHLVSEYAVLFEQVYGSIHSIVSQHEEGEDRMLEIKEQLKLAHKLTYGYFFYSIDSYMPTTNEDSISYELYSAVRNDVKKRMAQFRQSTNLERHTILGHYYRHLFNMVDYIDKAENIGKEHKEKYCKIVRSQLSDYEQVLLYYNTLSPLGNAWNDPLGETDPDKMCLIAKYRLIKNCPYYLNYAGIQPLETYAKEIAAYREKGQRFFDTGPM